MSMLFSKNTYRPKWARAKLVWGIEEFREVSTLARSLSEKQKSNIDPHPLGIHGNRIYSPEFGDSATGFWSMVLVPGTTLAQHRYTADPNRLHISLQQRKCASPVIGYYTLASLKPDGSTVLLNSPCPDGSKMSLLKNDGSHNSVDTNISDLVENNALTICCEVQIYCGMNEVSSVDCLPGNECILLKPSEDDELRMDCKEALGVPCPKDILVAKIPAVRPLFKEDKANGHYVVSVPNTDLLTLTRLVEYIKTNRCSLLDKGPTHVGDGSDKSCLEVDTEFINLLSAANRLELTGLVEACLAVMKRSVPVGPV